MTDEKMDISERIQCGFLDYKSILNSSGGLCSGCASELKEINRIKHEKKQRIQESGYFQNTGKYKKKDKLKSTFKW